MQTVGHVHCCDICRAVMRDESSGEFAVSYNEYVIAGSKLVKP